jgi:D-glycero-D-manno-heptose 1,7-bisphosphate phosphatase
MTAEFMRPALFLDRDGVINIEREYVHRIDDFEFVEGIFELCRWATARGLAIVVVTNQSGIGRGYYSEADFLTLSHWMCARFDEAGAPISGVYYCPFHPEHGVGKYKQESLDRKPNPGMILRAKNELGLNLCQSILIGDKPSDIMAGVASGVGLTVLIGENDGICKPSIVVNSLSQALLQLDRGLSSD